MKIVDQNNANESTMNTAVHNNAEQPEENQEVDQQEAIQVQSSIPSHESYLTISNDMRGYAEGENDMRGYAVRENQQSLPQDHKVKLIK